MIISMYIIYKNEFNPFESGYNIIITLRCTYIICTYKRNYKDKHLNYLKLHCSSLDVEY